MKDLEGEWTIFQLEAELEHFGPHRIMKIHNEVVKETSKYIHENSKLIEACDQHYDQWVQYKGRMKEASRLLTLVLEMAQEGDNDMEMLKLDMVDVERLLEAKKVLEDL